MSNEELLENVEDYTENADEVEEEQKIENEENIPEINLETPREIENEQEAQNSDGDFVNIPDEVEEVEVKDDEEEQGANDDQNEEEKKNETQVVHQLEEEREETAETEVEIENIKVDKVDERVKEVEGKKEDIEDEQDEEENEEDVDEEDELRPPISHPDTSLLDITQIEIEEKDESYYGLFGRGIYRFPDIQDPGIDEALNYVHEEPRFDDVGIERYLFVCKALNVVPVSRFLRELPGGAIKLGYYGLDPRGVRGIAEALFRNKTVKSVDFEDNWLTRDAVYHLGEMLKENIHITHLNLHGCRIGLEGVHRLKEGILLTQALKELDLSWNYLGDEGMEELTPALMDNCSIKRLILSHNNLGNQTGIFLGTIVGENWALQHLDLSWNNMCAKEGMKAFFTNLILNHSISSINLSWNGINTKEVAKEIRAYLAGSEVIQYLDLSSNRLEDAALKMIKAGVKKNESLLCLKLGRNPLLPEDALEMLKVLQIPTTVLHTLDMADIWVHKEFLQTLAQIKQVRKCEVNIGGVYSNYVIKGPNVRKLLFDRAKFEAMKPKSKKKKKDVGHFILKMDVQKPVKRAKFITWVQEAKMKLDENLVLEIMKNFPAPKKCVDVQAMKDYYLELYPDTQLPPEKPKKGKKGKRKKKAGAKK